MNPVERPRAASNLIEAAKVLLAQMPPSAISGRQLAEAAGVKYGLIHRHFGTKDAVFRVALDDLTSNLLRTGFVDGLPGPRALDTHSNFVRAMVQISLDRESFDNFHARSPIVERYLEGLSRSRPELSDVQARATVAVGVCTLMGAAMYGPTLVAALDLSGAPVELSELIDQWVSAMHTGAGPLGDVPTVTDRRDRSTARQAPEADKTQFGRGREATMNRLIDAGADLLATRSPSSISGRELADAAGVNYGLIHHYFGSKNEVLQQSLQRHRDRFFQAVSETEGPIDLFTVSDHPGFVRAITTVALDDGFQPGEQRFPSLDRLLDQFGLSATDPDDVTGRMALGAAVSAVLCWAMFDPFLQQGLGTRLDELEPVVASMLRSLIENS